MESDVDDLRGQLDERMQRRVGARDPARLLAAIRIAGRGLERDRDIAAARAVIRKDRVDELARLAFEVLEALLLADAVHQQHGDLLDGHAPHAGLGHGAPLRRPQPILALLPRSGKDLSSVYPVNATIGRNEHG